jgi:dipeptidyl aminopeptidase/acylaminoacyl peptidase
VTVRRLVLAVAVALGAVAGIVPRAEAAGTRYLDEVFTEIKTTKDIPYGEAVDYQGNWKTLLLDVHQPKGDKLKARPAVVWVHGGYFKRGSKEGYVNEWSQFARAGYLTVAINYRLDPTLPEGAGPAVTEGRIDEYIAGMVNAQHDAQAAVRWVRAHAKKLGVDPDRIAIAGHSAGGIVAQMVAFNDHDPGASGSPGPSSRVAAAVSSAGASLHGKTVRIDTGEPPLLVSHGVVDDVVPYPATVPTCVVTVALGNVCEQVLDPDQAHGAFGHAHWREFLYRRMVLTPVLSPPTNLTLVGLPTDA